jgi:hypothetical protein
MPKQEGEPQGNIYLERLEESRSHATELQKEIQETQGAQFGEAFLRIMERSQNNPKIIKAMHDFIEALDAQSHFGDPSEEFSPSKQKELAEFLNETSKALKWSVSGGGAGVGTQTEEIDLSKWSQ